MKILSYRRYGKKWGGNFFIYLIMYQVLSISRGYTQRSFIKLFTLKIVNTLIKNKLTRRESFDLEIRINQRTTRFVSGKASGCTGKRRPRRYQVDPWSRGREVAGGIVRSSPISEKISFFFLPSERGRDFFVVCFLRTSG